MTGSYVLAGVDGSGGSDAAVRWAAQEAVARRLPLRLLHAYSLPASATTGFAPIPVATDESPLQAEAVSVLDASAALARSIAPGLDVSTRLARASTAASALIESSGDAATIAVGSHGREGFVAMLLGSVAGHVTTHAHCPAVVVRGEWATPGLPVVVGVDGSDLSRRAAEVALRAASLRGAPLIAVRVLPTMHGIHSVRDDRWHAEVESARMSLRESMAGYRERYPGVAVEERVVPGHPADALVNAVQDPQLLVVGHGGGGAFSGMLLGSVAIFAVRHAPYTVEVVRAPTGTG